ncbi:MAG TPA: nuclear transport factor 2 family protein [Nitrososphaeraceae archaeon]|jgi:ketosteroid isomerase-like protein
MSKLNTPEEFLDSQVKEFNNGNVTFLITLYENDACFASKPGEVVKDLDDIRQSFQSLVDMGVKLSAKVRTLLRASDLALLITEWSINGIERDGKRVNLTGRGTVVLRQQADGSWRMVIENPWGTD